MHHHREYVQVIFCILIPISVACIHHRHRTDDCPRQMQTFATAIANVINRRCKRYKPPMQTFAVKVHYWEAEQGNG